jgi:hypothetical protein
MPPNQACAGMDSLFAVNKLRSFAHYDSVRTDSNEKERGISDMAKVAAKKKAVAKKKKPALKRTASKASKKRATKRRR